MLVNIKRLHPNAKIPMRARPGDAGMDLTAISKEWSPEDQVWIYSTGLAIEIPEGYVGLIFPRSSLFKAGLSLSNAVGVIDSGYRGEIKFMFYASTMRQEYNIGDRIGQLIVMPYPKVEFFQVAELSQSTRGEGGFGSTGK